jgi:uncharacterized membrane protein
MQQQQQQTGLFPRIGRLLRHRWRDERAVARAIPPDMVERLMQRVAASEQRHTGQIRICVEAGLPASYLWRAATARERAVTVFGKLRVWDTEHNNGVLIYLLLADQAIEIVADRALARRVDGVQWQQTLGRMQQAFAARRYEDGLTQALEEVSAWLVAYFPADARVSSGNRTPASLASAGGLPDRPVLSGDPLLES